MTLREYYQFQTDQHERQIENLAQFMLLASIPTNSDEQSKDRSCLANDDQCREMLIHCRQRARDYIYEVLDQADSSWRAVRESPDPEATLRQILIERSAAALAEEEQGGR
jgi:hypothetical protein